MTRSPIAATLIVILFLVGAPIALIRRLSDGLLPTQAYDIVLAIAVAAWVLICKAILDRNNPTSKVVANRLSPAWQAHSVVEQSVFGVGFISKKDSLALDSPTQLLRLQSPSSPIESLMPPVVVEPAPGRVRAEHDEGSRPRLQPTLRLPENAAPPITATEDYVVARGDTFWSIAEARLGDGRRWKQIEEINIGRQVSNDKVFGEGDGVRIGWSLLVPVAEAVVESVS